MTSPAEPLSGRTILLVDDDRAVRYILVRALQEAGYGVVEAGDGAQAWTCFQGNPGRFDAVVTDVMMPQMPGTVLAARVHATRPSLPVLLMSAYSPAELLERGLEAAHENLMSKPFNPDQLVAAVRHILGEATTDA
jgi:CheY-like chemotaxis protein